MIIYLAKQLRWNCQSWCASSSYICSRPVRNKLAAHWQTLNLYLHMQIADKRKSLLRFVQDVESRDLLDDFHQAAPLSVGFAILSESPSSYVH